MSKKYFPDTFGELDEDPRRILGSRFSRIVFDDNIERTPRHRRGGDFEERQGTKPKLKRIRNRIN